MKNFQDLNSEFLAFSLALLFLLIARDKSVAALRASRRIVRLNLL